MDPFTIVLTVFFAASAAGITWWLVQADQTLSQMKDEMQFHRESTRSSLIMIHSAISSLDAGAKALLAAQPQHKGIVEGHAALAKIEAQLSRDDSGMELSKTAKNLLKAIKTLVGGTKEISIIDETVDEDAPLLHLISRFYDIINRCSLRPCDLGLNSTEYQKLGSLVYACGHLDWATECYEEAHLKAPGNVSTLEALEHLSIESGNTDGRRIWLEARIKLDPDNPELLRTRAHLLVQLGDESAEKDVRRLEALGVDTAADRSLLSGLRARAGSKSEALEAIDSALQEDPSRADDWRKKAELHESLDDMDMALSSVEQALSLNRQDGESWALKARLLAMKSSELQQALKAAIHAVALDAGGTSLILLKANLLSASGREEESQESLEKELVKSPSNAELRSSMASMSMNEGDLGKAEALLRGAGVEGNNSSSLKIVWGRLHLAYADLHRDGTGETDRNLLSSAGKSFQEAVDLDRENGIAWLGVSRVQRLCGDLELAQESITRAKRLLEDEPALATEGALLALDIGQPTEAQRLIEEASIQDMTSATIPYVKGNISCAFGRFNEARNYFDEALNDDPTHIRARLNRVSVLMALDRPEEALNDCEKLLKIAPGLLLARCRRAESKMLLAQWASAKEDLEHILEANQRHPHALTQLAACEIALGKPEHAEAPLNEALRHDPNHAPAWHERGLLYLEWGREEAALADFIKAAKADEEHLDARLHIAAIHHESQNWDKASDAWRAVLSLDPEHNIARKRFDEVELKIASSAVKRD